MAVLQPAAQAKSTHAYLRQEEGDAQRQQHYTCVEVVLGRRTKVKRALCDDLRNHVRILERAQREGGIDRGRVVLGIVPYVISLGRRQEVARGAHWHNAAEGQVGHDGARNCGAARFKPALHPAGAIAVRTAPVVAHFGIQMRVDLLLEHGAGQRQQRLQWWGGDYRWCNSKLAAG